MDVSPNQGGNIKIDGTFQNIYPATTNITSGQSVRLEAVPASGYDFLAWSGSVTGKDNPATLVVDCTKSLTATFVRKVHSLTIEVKGAGSVTPLAGGYRYPEGTIVSVTATPDNGYQFDGWTGDVADVRSASTNVTIDSSKTVIANFSQKRHILSIEVSGAGSVVPPAGDHSYVEGAVVNVTATPDDGYQLDGWSGHVSDPALASITVTMGSDTTIVANFSKIKRNPPPPVGAIAGGIVIAGVVAGGTAWLAVRRRKNRT